MSIKSLSNSFFLDIQELSRPCNVCTISVRWHTSIKDIKDTLKQMFNVPPSRMSLYHASSPKSLRNQTTLHDLFIEASGHVLRVAFNVPSNSLFQLISLKDIEVDADCKRMLSLVRHGFEHSQVPAKTDILDCTGGVYFLKAANGERVAVFKPSDEEQGMPNNPKGHAGSGEEGLRPHFRPGQGYLRETAAYLMDRDGFSQVPPTTIVHCEHASFHYPSAQGQSAQRFPKAGSLQQFVHASDTFEDISPSLVGALELQKIALLDIRLLNCDRNSSNILARRKAVPNTFHTGARCRRDSRSSSMGSQPSSSHPDELMVFGGDEDFEPRGDEGSDLYELIPIDHGYCMPARLQIDELDWIWFYCPQVAQEVDPEIKRYLATLDIDDLLDALDAQLKIPEYNCFLLRLAHQVLVEGVAAGLTLFEVAGLVARTEEGRPSLLEKVVRAAEDNAHRTLEMQSNRLSSRGFSSGQSLSSVSASSHHSPVRFADSAGFGCASRGVTPLGGRAGRLPSMDRTASLESGRSCQMSRVVQSAADLQGMGREAASPRGLGRTQSLKLAVPGYLSIENVERLQQSSPQLAKFPAAGFLAGPTTASPAPGDFFMAELSPAASPPKERGAEAVCGPSPDCEVPLGLLSRSLLFQEAGGPLRTMQSVDSQPRGRLPSPLAIYAPHSRKPSGGAASASYLRTGTLPEEPSELYYPRSEPIMIALRDSSSGAMDHDSTSCEVSSKEEDGCSPKSFGFGDAFFASSAESLAGSQFTLGSAPTPLSAESQSLYSAFTQADTQTPFGSAGGSSKKTAAERPFPPRALSSRSPRRSASEGDQAALCDSSPETSGEEDEGRRRPEVALLPRDASISSFISLRSLGGVSGVGGGGAHLQRVASFNAFESPAIYEERHEGERQMNSLHRQQRKAAAGSAEFQELRLTFATSFVTLVVGKEARRKAAKRTGRFPGKTGAR